MTIEIADYKNIIYSEEYSDNASPRLDLAKRVLLAAVPFLCLHSSLRFPVSIAMRTLRVWNTNLKDIFGTVVAVVALVGTIFQHRVGMIAATIQIITIEINKIRKAENYQDVSKSLIKILTNLVYLALIYRGGLELSVIAFVMRSCVNLIQSIDEFKSDRWIEGVANLLMAGIRLQQSHNQYQQLKVTRADSL